MSGYKKQLFDLFNRIEKLKLDENNHFILKSVKALILKNQELEINAEIIQDKLEEYINSMSKFNDECIIFNDELNELLKDKENSSQ